MEDVRKVNMQMPEYGEFNESVILIEEVRAAVNNMKSGKAPGLDGLFCFVFLFFGSFLNSCGC